ncbi:MAG: hypothetical protein GY696_34325 [Gammaproteobacteria bacterium]|nr:hypothetical protein [Gammaproteobacteria bacterium]
MIEAYKNKLKYLALLDAILEQDWELRYYSYNSSWSSQEEMASLRDSCGGEWFFLVTEKDIAFKCTSPVDGLVDDFQTLKNQVPEKYSAFLNEPAFSMDEGSCIWYLEDNNWIALGNAINDLPNPIKIQKMTALDYCNYAREILEQDIDSNIVQSIFDGNFTFELAVKLNPDIDINALKNEVSEIGISS